MSDATETASQTARRQVMRAAGIVSAAFLVSKLLGLARDMVQANYLGLEQEATAYFAAITFPDAIFFIVAGGAIGSAFIPTFAAYFARDDDAGAWRLFSGVLNLIVAAVTALAGAAILFAPELVETFLPKLVAQNPELLPLTVRLMRIMLLSSIIFGASGVMMGTLQARQHFLLPAIAPIIYNLGIIAGAVAGGRTDLGAAAGMAWGTVAGALGHLLIQLPGLRWKGARYTAVFTLRDPGVRQVLKLMAPRVLGLSFSQVNAFITLFLSGLITPESVPASRLALRLMLMPQGMLGQALGIAAFPTMADLAAQEAFAQMRRILSDSLRLLAFLALPATALLMLVGQPVIVLLFQRGAFVAEDAGLVAWALLFYALGLLALSALEVVNRAFFALSDTLTPVLAGAIQIAAMAGLSVWLIRGLFPALGWHPLGGLALGFSLSNFVEAAALLWLLRRKMGGLNGRLLWSGLWRMLAASGVMAGGMWLALRGLAQTAVLWQVVAGSLVGAAVYVVASYLLGIREIRRLAALLQSRLGKPPL